MSAEPALRDRRQALPGLLAGQRRPVAARQQGHPRPRRHREARRPAGQQQRRRRPPARHVRRHAHRPRPTGTTFERSLYLHKAMDVSATAHQAGTIRFGTDPSTSALDIHCKTNDLDNLRSAQAAGRGVPGVVDRAGLHAADGPEDAQGLGPGRSVGDGCGPAGHGARRGRGPTTLRLAGRVTVGQEAHHRPATDLPAGRRCRPGGGTVVDAAGSVARTVPVLDGLGAGLGGDDGRPLVGLRGGGTGRCGRQRVPAPGVRAALGRVGQGRVAELRSVLRFLYLQGVTPLRLGAAVPPVGGWRLAALPPPALSSTEVQRLLESCDRSSAVGSRDFAIMMLLARLGFRSVEVARLQLGDVDWCAGELVVRGKGRRQDRLPLPNGVGERRASCCGRVLACSRSARSFVIRTWPPQPSTPRSTSTRCAWLRNPGRGGA